MKRIRRMTAALLSVLAVFLLLPLQALAAGSKFDHFLSRWKYAPGWCRV